MTDELKAKVAKLPAWAQTLIRDLEWQRQNAVNALNESVKGNDDSRVYYQCALLTGEESGPTFKRFNIPENDVNFILNGDLTGHSDGGVVSVSLRTNDYEQNVAISFDSYNIVMLPSAGNCVRLVWRPRETRR